MSERDS